MFVQCAKAPPSALSVRFGLSPLEQCRVMDKFAKSESSTMLRR